MKFFGSTPPLSASVGADMSHVIAIVPPTTSAFSDDAISKYLGALQDVIDASIASDEADAKAKTDAARKQYVGWASTVAGFAGGPAASKIASDYAGTIFDAGHWIASTFGPDDLKDANTDDQKSRMRDRVTSMLRMGLPPHGFDPGQEMGARDVADVIEDDLAIVKAVSPHGEGNQIALAINAALRGEGLRESTDRVSELFTQLAIVRTDTRRTMWGGVTATYLVDQAGKMKPGTNDYRITHPEIEIVAAAFAASRGIALSTATTFAYDAINTYAKRRGLTTPNDILGPAYKPRDPAVTDSIATWYNRNARGDAIIDVWNTLGSKYGSSPKGGGPILGSDAARIATAGAVGYLAYKFVWPMIKGRFL